MKGQIVSIVEKTWTNPEGQNKVYHEFTVLDNPVIFSCWQPMDQKAGDIIDFEPQGEIKTFKDKSFQKARLAGSTTTGKGGGFRGKSPEELKQQRHSFSASYAKDIVVAMINQGILTTPALIDTTLLHYDKKFQEIMGG